MNHLTIDRHIEKNPEIRNGQPHLSGTRISVADLAVMHLKLGMSLLEIAGKYNLNPASVHAAMAYYYDHRAEIDQRIESDTAFAETFRNITSSPLREKLRALTDG